MSEELQFDAPLSSSSAEMEGKMPTTEMPAAEEEFEEITSEEVDRVVALLEELMESVDSENIRTYLEEAMNNIYYLIYEDEDEEGFSEEEAEMCEEGPEESDDSFSEAA